MIRLLHLADLHLGWESRTMPDDKSRILRKERDKILEKAVDFALQPGSKIDGVIIVGDLFEKYNPEEALIRETLRQMNRLIQSNKLCVTVPGNHDEITYHNSVYREYGKNWPGFLITNPMPEHCFSVTIHDTLVHFYSLAYTGGLTKPYAIASFPYNGEDGFHIGAFHGSLDWEVSDRSLPLFSNVLASAKYDYIALGHIHQFTEKQVGWGKAVYPGSIGFKSSTDAGTGFFTVVEWNGSMVKVEKVPVDVREYKKIEVDASLFNDSEHLLAELQKHNNPNLIATLVLHGVPQFEIDEELLIQMLERNFFYLELLNESDFYSDRYLENIASEQTIRGYFVRRMKLRIEDIDDEKERKLLENALLKGLQALEGGK